jgi:hypothetical protein
MKRTSQAGNALFLILIAVALFAALSYAVTQSGRGSSSIDREQTSLNTTQIIQYAGLIEQEVQRMQMISGCSDTEVSFENDRNSRDFNRSPAADSSCELFVSEGGNIAYNPPFGGDDDMSFTSRFCIKGVGTDVASNCVTDERELLFITFGMDDAFCKEINRRLGLDNAVDPLPEFDMVTYAFTGDYSAGINPRLGSTASSSVLTGERTACLKDDGGSMSGTNFFYHVLIAR